MVVLHKVHGNLPVVDYLLLGKEVRDIGFLQESIALVLLISENAGDGGLIPGLFPVTVGILSQVSSLAIAFVLFPLRNSEKIIPWRSPLLYWILVFQSEHGTSLGLPLFFPFQAPIKWTFYFTAHHHSITWTFLFTTH